MDIVAKYALSLQIACAHKMARFCFLSRGKMLTWLAFFSDCQLRSGWSALTYAEPSHNSDHFHRWRTSSLSRLLKWRGNAWCACARTRFAITCPNSSTTTGWKQTGSVWQCRATTPTLRRYNIRAHTMHLHANTVDTSISNQKSEAILRYCDVLLHDLNHY